MDIKDIFCFNKFVTPTFINIIYWISVVASVISGLVMIFASFSSYYGGAGVFISGLLTMVFGILFSRVMCELTLVIFKIHDNLKKIADSKEPAVVETVEHNPETNI